MKQAMTERRVRSVGIARILALIALCGLFMGATSAMAADPGKGRQIYMQHCQNCHGLGGTPQMPGIPDFRRGESLFKPDLELVRKIRTGQGMMPAYEGLFTEEELLDVVAFLRTLR